MDERKCLNYKELRTHKRRRYDADFSLARQHASAAASCRQEQIKALAKDIDALIGEDPDQRQRMEIIDSVPGLAADTARTLTIEAPELDNLDDAEIASLVGVAPMNHDSGSSKGTRHIQGGRAVVRTAAYKALVPTVTRGYNPVPTAYYNQLLAAGKPFKVAIVACVRKLFRILNAMIRNRTQWQQYS